MIKILLFKRPHLELSMLPIMASIVVDLRELLFTVYHHTIQMMPALKMHLCPFMAF
jgi:hypothetical protein